MADIIQTLILGLALGGVFALMGSGLSLVFGVMRIVNLAHPVLIIAGAYVAYWGFRLYGIDPLMMLPVAIVILAAIGVVLYKLVFEREARSAKYSEMTVLLTFAIAMIVEGALGGFFSNTQRVTSPDYATDAIFIGDVFIPTGQLYAGILSLIIISVLALFLKYSSFGYAIRATTQNREAAELLGVNVNRVALVSFAIGIGLAGAAGCLVSFVFSFFPAKHWEWIAVLMSLVVLGGMGSLLGTVVASFLLSVIAAFVGTYVGATWSTMTFFLALFLILLVRPQGLFGEKPELA
ncbi:MULTISPECIES: branched-chain amino acid ABC transporter permease [Stappiaceae]|jgi:branched-chain amino acid transport system permease protein|uniref:branched-chain amino acid ABC transporter permease n=1 Tax=Stappiaceae TaxID=2821832 RepID=UPI00126852FA|nr:MULTISPECIES: branched-chain amino acid ABC transporter permease [Stappiaceae]MCR9283968.1 branched-chain amino acid ABC transporter permease [Paracoccaceae bacterium]MEC9422544.1 branched-chain amino acid ABC transporter permease [Pseudomonadota bacterium]NKI58190.1 branched-chain amino acid ABC transporter permease [Labrenzia sp. PO1]QFT67026.1 High-affinity branched-chain amino acid transport system permease protein LivH [Labrenzia sp. THAF35]UES38569.1 branched-chain amino acid ABC tran